MTKSQTYLSIALCVHSMLCVTEVLAQSVTSCDAVPGNVNFGSITVGGSNIRTVSVNNTGIGPVTVLAAAVTGAGFGISGPSLPVILLAGQSVSFDASFAPTVAGTVTGNISITSTAANSPASVSLSGTGVTLQIFANPASTNFGEVVLGDRSYVPVFLTNTGTGSVTISQANVAGRDFSISGLSLPLTLGPGQSTGYSVTFAPTASGPVNGNVSIVSTATNSPTDEPLSGAGIHAVTLSWQASTSTVAGYNVYRGNVSGGPYTRVNASLINGTSYMDTSVQSGQTYYYVVTAADNNNESGYSNQASGLVPSS